MSEQIVIFSCDDKCAEQLYKDNQPAMFPAGFLRVRKADDLAGLELETLDMAWCTHRWSAGVVTAYNHLTWVIDQMDPVEVWTREARERG